MELISDDWIIIWTIVWKIDLSSPSIEEVAISEFKAKWLAILDRVQKTKQPVRITRRGKSVADVVTAQPSVMNRAALIC